MKENKVSLDKLQVLPEGPLYWQVVAVQKLDAHAIRTSAPAVSQLRLFSEPAPEKIRIKSMRVALPDE